MKIYCVRDRLLDFYMQPFAAPSDKHVLQGLSNVINNPEATDAISQAPHQFEIYCLGYVTDDGHLVAERTFVADASTLVRADLRANSRPGAGESHTADRGN